MIVDASAMVAVMHDEEGASDLLGRLSAARSRSTHPVSLYEAAMATSRKKSRTTQFGYSEVERFCAVTDIECVTIDASTAAAALDAFARYGKGNHPAGLNMGDCFSYALAKLRGVPLLYKGEDFAQTDLA